LEISAERTWVERAERLRREADLSLAKGHHAPAEKLYREASDMLLSAFGSSHTNYAESLSDLAMAYLAMARYPEAIAHYQHVVDIYRMAVGEDGPLYLTGLGNLAAAHRAMGGFSEAQSLYRQALQIHGKSPRKDFTGRILVELAWIYAHTGRVREALDVLCDAERAHDQMIAEVVARGSEREQLACRESMREAYFLFVSFVSRYCPDSSDATQALLEVIFRRKALWIEMALAQRDASMRDRSLSIHRRYEALRSLRQEIARNTVQGLSADETPDVRYRELHNRDTERRELEVALAREVAGLNPFGKRLGGIDLHAVASALPSNSALVELVKFRRYDFESIQNSGRDSWQEYRYLAVVLVDGAAHAVRIVDLGEALTIDRLMTRFRSWIMRAANAQHRGFVSDDEPSPDALESPGMALRAAVFDPLRPALGGRSRVSLAADGELARIPFEALPLDSAGRYLADDYRLSYVDTGRDLLGPGLAIDQISSSPVVVADPDFDLAQRSVVRTLWQGWRSRFVRTTTQARPFTGRSSRQPRDDDRNEWHFERLPGTRIEGELIAGMLGVPLWHGSGALEKHLKDRVSPRILHLATHGFFLRNQPFNPPTTGGCGGLAQRFLPIEENPLLRCGLALAGANHAFTPEVLPEEAEDGLLTAEDVACLDLQGTEIVVLSACETGLGEVQIGEGVFGLRRAFVLAGAKTLIMSLWKVADLPTAILMTRLYENLIEARMPRDEALRQAQHYLRQLSVGQLRSRWFNTESVKRLADDDANARAAIEGYLAHADPYQPFDHPYYWAAFILLGNTTPLVQDCQP